MRECPRGHRRAPATDPRGHQPVAAAGGLQRLRAGPVAGRGASTARAATGPRTRPVSSGAICGGPDVIARGALANENPPRLRTHDRFGNRIDEVEFHPAWHELLQLADLARAARARRGATRGRARTWPGRRCSCSCSQVEAGHGLPDLDDLLRDARAAQAAGAGRRVGAALPVALLRRRTARPRAGQDGRAVRHGDDREAGRLRRARQHHRRQAAERRRAGRRVRDHRAQVVLLGADVRRVPGPGAGRRGPFVLPAAALHARRRAQPVPHPAAQGQARQPLERLQRGRVPTAPGRGWSARRAAACRRSSRWSTTPGSTACSAPAPGMRWGTARRSITPAIAPRSASRWSTSR